MEINKIEIQDSSGNIYYPKTSSDIVVYKQTQTTLTQKIDNVYTKQEIDIFCQKLQNLLNTIK